VSPTAGFTFMRPVSGLASMHDISASLCETMSSSISSISSLSGFAVPRTLAAHSRTKATSATTSCTTDSLRMLRSPAPAPRCRSFGFFCDI